MKKQLEKVIKKPSIIPYNYATIRITPSRLDKGLLAVPRQLSSNFPMQNQEVQIYLNDSTESQIKPYSSYNSSTRECRINGLKDWFRQNAIKIGDEIAIHFIDRERFIYQIH